MTPRRPLADVLAEADGAARAGQAYAAAPLPTGFEPLDAELDGGVRPGELVLVGGAQGLGKTMLALQLARNVVASGGTAAYVCYEHDERMLLQRLIGVEAAELADAPDDAPTLRVIGALLRGGPPTSGGMAEQLAVEPLAAKAYERLREYGDRLDLVRASGRATGVAEIREIARAHVGTGLVVVDYLQKVPVDEMSTTAEDERVTVVVEALKDIAMDVGVPIVAITAADKDGIGTGRTRLRHLRGSTALAYECDIALILNDKWHIVARHHLVYGSANADRFHEWVVCTIEKNRSGTADIDLEFRKQYARGRLDPAGNRVVEELVDDRLFRD
jgi:replicative DNA helicase